MKILKSSFFFVILLIFVSDVTSAQEPLVCPGGSPCSGKTIVCPQDCPSTTQTNGKGKVCTFDCNSKSCKPRCKHAKPKTELFTCPKGSQCYGKPMECLKNCPSRTSMNDRARICNVDCNSQSCKPSCETVKRNIVTCDKGRQCLGKDMKCPRECPSDKIPNHQGKVCFADCLSPNCRPQCTLHKPNCDRPGSACHDPRFIGGDGIVFYFHGKSNEHFSLVSDSSLQINGRFTGHRPAGRSRDFTWIQALGILFKSHKFSLGAIKVATWSSELDHIKFSYNGEDLVISEGSLSFWNSPEGDLKVERIADKNAVIVTLKDTAELMINVVPVTKEDDRIHNYSLPADDCFAHLEVQFRFFALSPMVDGVIGKTYRPDFVNPAKPGVAMPVVGGEDNYRTTSLLSADCSTCLFSTESASNSDKDTSSVTNYDFLDCTHDASTGYGIVCKK